MKRIDSQLSGLRKRIDNIDSIIIVLLSRRARISREIALYKNLHKLPVYQKKRENEALTTRRQSALKHNLNPGFIAKLFKLIILESRKIQLRKILPS